MAAPTPTTARTLTPRPAALGWPAWTDADVYQLGPAPDDDAWHAQQSPDHHASEPTPPEILNDPTDHRKPWLRPLSPRDDRPVVSGREWIWSLMGTSDDTDAFMPADWPEAEVLAARQGSGHPFGPDAEG
jgi:hypothetical protein